MQVGIQHPRGFLALRQYRVKQRQRHIGDIDVAADGTTYLRIGNLNVTVKLPVISQFYQPVCLCPAIVQARIEV
ncbi:hypothetical protein D3C75_1202730 [compost metagenome]